MSISEQDWRDLEAAMRQELTTTDATTRRQRMTALADTWLFFTAAAERAHAQALESDGPWSWERELDPAADVPM